MEDVLTVMKESVKTERQTSLKQKSICFDEPEAFFGYLTSMDLDSVERILRAHCDRIIVCAGTHPIESIRIESLSAEITFQDASWVDPFYEKGLMKLLFRYVIEIQYMVGGVVLMNVRAADRPSLLEKLDQAIGYLADRHPNIVKLFEEMYGIRFSALKVGTYPFRR